MNIDHVQNVDMPKEPVFVAIFKRQQELEEKYFHIEMKNGFYYPPIPRPHIDDAQLQHWIKGMFWRTHEEIAEALETIPDLEGNWRQRWDGDADLRHFFEELSDALHFLTAVSLMMDVKPMAVQNSWERMKEKSEVPGALCDKTELEDEQVVYFAGIFSFALGLTANSLKNKPWKTTQMPTDEKRFKGLLIEAWDRFNFFWMVLGCELSDIWQLYHKKNAVNAFRQISKY